MVAWKFETGEDRDVANCHTSAAYHLVELVESASGVVSDPPSIGLFLEIDVPDSKLVLRWETDYCLTSVVPIIVSERTNTDFGRSLVAEARIEVSHRSMSTLCSIWSRNARFGRGREIPDAGRK